MADRIYLESLPRNVQDALYDGSKILAVKLAREAKGWDLARANEEVMLVESQLREQCPEGFAHPDLTPQGPAVSADRLYLDTCPVDVQNAIYEGHKVKAIKLLRTATGRDLKASKEEVEAIQGQLRAQCPQGFSPAAGKGGCTVTTGAFLVLLIGAAGFLHWLPDSL